MEVQFELDGHNFRVLDGPYVEDNTATNAANDSGKQLISALPEMREFASNKLLNTYNDSWTDDAHHELTAKQFEAKLVNPQIVIYDELGAATIYFADSDMFGGHSVEVIVYNGEINHTSIVG